jgi:hypothetical protein
MGAFKTFMGGILRLPFVLQAWLFVLMAANMLVPLVFLERLEARVVLATFALSFPLMLAITEMSGFTRILGLGHTLWLLLVPFLVTRLGSVPPDDAYGMWIRAVIVLNVISLVFDVWDVVRFARGDREAIVEF